jgi:hypothetical protein
MNNAVHALYPMRAMLRTGLPVASQTLTVSTSAVAFTGFTPAVAGGNGVTLVTFDVQSNPVVARWDGTDPTASVGHTLASGASYTWDVAQFNAAKFIRQGGADAVIFASPMSV